MYDNQTTENMDDMVGGLIGQAFPPRRIHMIEFEGHRAREGVYMFLGYTRKKKENVRCV